MTKSSRDLGDHLCTRCDRGNCELVQGWTCRSVEWALRCPCLGRTRVVSAVLAVWGGTLLRADSIDARTLALPGYWKGSARISTKSGTRIGRGWLTI